MYEVYEYDRDTLNVFTYQGSVKCTSMFTIRPSED